MRNVSEKFAGQIKTHLLNSINFFENPYVYETKWKNILQQAYVLCVLDN
jgi:hypothetical protein